MNTPSRNVCSATDPLVLNIQKCRLKNYGDKAFSVVAPTEWNTLPTSVRSSKSLPNLQTLSKTHLFSSKEGAEQTFPKSASEHCLSG